jgi:peptide-methionine (R)-S-oxide reductase
MQLIATSLFFVVVVWAGSSGLAESFLTTGLTATIYTLTNTTTRNSQQRPAGRMMSSPQRETNAEGDKPAAVTTTTTTTKVERKTWNPLRLAVLRLGLTEPMMISPFNYGGGSSYKDGVFRCAYCGHELFDGTAKYDSRSGWPSFWRSRQDDSISYRMESDGRLECKCQRCDSHLGHVFLDGPQPTTVDATLLRESPESDPRGRSGLYLPRFCINGAALTYTKSYMKKS